MSAQIRHNKKLDLLGRVAVVTGGTKGVGRGIGHDLAQHGARVFVTGRSAPDHERLDERITGIRCDHRVDTQVEVAFNLIVREAKAIDILVNNVWGGYERMIEDGNFTWPKPFWEQPLWRWDAMFSAGVRAHYQASQLAAPTMIARRRGLIVNISSWAAQKTMASLSKCLKFGGDRKAVLITLKIAVFAPMPSARVSTA